LPRSTQENLTHGNNTTASTTVRPTGESEQHAFFNREMVRCSPAFIAMPAGNVPKRGNGVLAPWFRILERQLL
jgi:hypothetical protein